MRGELFIKGLKKYLKEINYHRSFFKMSIAAFISLTIVLSIDILDIPSRIIIGFPTLLTVILIAGLSSIIILSLLYYNVIDYFKIINVNELDFFAIESSIFCFIGLFKFVIVDGFYNYKSIISFFTLIVSLVVVCFRSRRYQKVLFNSNFKSNLFDLKSVYNNDFSIKNGQPVLLYEKDVDYDLLEREAIKNQLKNIIVNYFSDRSYVIGLIGEWGSGKTTLINIVKKELTGNEKLVFIDDFDPWIVGSAEVLLLTMYEKILQNTGIKFSPSRNKRITNVLRNIVIGIGENASNVSGIRELTKELLNDKSYDEVSKLKDEVSRYLIANEKTVVFIVDNIDRAEPNNIALLFKFIGTLFDLPNVLYILSFDKKRVECILEESSIIFPKYLEKIIQQEIYIPKIKTEHLNYIYNKCTINILGKYGINSDDYYKFESIIDWMSKNITDIRNYKRLINSAFSVAFSNSEGLDPFSQLIIEIIHFNESELYDSIIINNGFYISSDRFFDAELFTESFNEEDYNAKAKAYFDQIKNKYESSLSLLALIFPNVKRYCSNQKIFCRSYYRNSELESKIPIYSTKFFDLYFSHGRNDLLVLHNDVKDLVKCINSSKADMILNEKIYKQLIDIPNEYQQEKMVAFESYLSEINSEKYLFLLLVLWNNIWKMDAENAFVVLSARNRTLVIISKIIKEINISDLKQFCDFSSNDYSKVYILSKLIYWLNSSSLLIAQEKKELVESIYNEMCKNIINNEIDLYCDTYYHHNNAWGLIHCYQDDENKDGILRPYFTNLYSDENVYRCLGDTISIKRGRKNYYRIEIKTLDLLYLDRKKIEKSFLKNPPKTESERLIKEVYDKSLSNNANDYEESGIETEAPIIFDLS